MVTAFVATVLIVVAVGSDGTEEDGSAGASWMLGLLLILAPLLAAATTRSVASSRLLRPVGGVSVVLCVPATALHIGVAVEARGPSGWAYGAPALATCILLVAVVARGPDPARHRVDEPHQDGLDEADVDHAALVGRTPLDVVTPLRRAREHAAKSALAWVVLLVLAPIVALPIFRVLGWPRAVARVEATVVDIRTVGDSSMVTFEAHGERALRWTDDVENSTWELGEGNVAYLDDDGNVHEDRQLGLAGIPLFGPTLFVLVFGAFAGRRLWGLMVALWDVEHGDDSPRLGYAAVINDPAPRTWRPLLATWDRDPTRTPRLAKPDAVYRADDETSEDLQCIASRVVVRRAWIDTGMHPRAKPRWVGFEHGVAVPHRRSLFGRTYVRIITKRAKIEDVVPLRHGPPATTAQPTIDTLQGSSHRLGGMILWRLLAIPAGIGMMFLEVDHGHPVETEGPRLDVWESSPDFSG